MSASHKRERMWRYAAADATGDDIQAATYAIAPFDTPDGACWVAYAPQSGRESTVALRRTAIGRATFTVSNALGFLESDLVRLQRTGTLYSLTGLQDVPSVGDVILTGETVERGQYGITEDVPAFTAANVILNPASLTMSVGPNAARRLRATVTNADSVVLQDRPVVWLSSDYSIALVDAQGRVEGIQSGTATITATSGDAVGACAVTVL